MMLAASFFSQPIRFILYPCLHPLNTILMI